MTASFKQELASKVHAQLGYCFARRVARRSPQWVDKHFHKNPNAAVAAFWRYNDGRKGARRDFRPRMIARALEFDYLKWPRSIAHELTGKDVLDVGCGTGVHGIGFVVVGVRSYTGMDPNIDLDDDRAKNIRRRTKEPFGWTGRQIMRRMPRVRLFPGTFEDFGADDKFDVVVLHNVTEHMINIEPAMADFWKCLRPGGRLVYHHHNYYAWNGHHQPPKTVAAIEPGDPEQAKFLDWNHLALDEPTRQHLAKKLNFIRLDELRELTERYFEIGQWEEKPSDAERGAGRLTPEIQARFPQYEEREFTVQNVLCTATRRPIVKSNGQA